MDLNNTALLNQTPEQLARDEIDKQLLACGWVIQHKLTVNLSAAPGIAVQEFQTDIGRANYILFFDKIPIGIIEAKHPEDVHLTMHEEQTEDYATTKLNYLNNEPLFFGDKSTGDVTRFPDFRDMK